VFSFPVQPAGPLSLLQFRASLEKCGKCTVRGKDTPTTLSAVVDVGKIAVWLAICLHFSNNQKHS